MKKRVYLTPMEVETELQKKREECKFIGDTEEIAIKQMVESAKRNSRIADKVLLVLSPYHVHIPFWQRKLYLPKALEIGNNYDPYKWGIPKVLYIDGKLLCADGMHRLYGVELSGIENVVVEVITDITEKEAINLFLDQGNDRRYMSPVDTYNAAIEAEKPEYLKLKKICTQNHIKVKGDYTPIGNPIGILTTISDGVNMAKGCPETLNKILSLIERLQWNGANIYDGKAYSAKVLRVLKKLYAYYDGKEYILENTLLNMCRGSQYFNDVLMEKCQDTLFDHLSMIVEANAQVVQMPKKKRISKAKSMAH